MCNNAQPIEILFCGMTLVGPKNHVLSGGQDRTNPFAAARSDKSAGRLIDKYYFADSLLFNLGRIVAIASGSGFLLHTE